MCVPELFVTVLSCACVCVTELCAFVCVTELCVCLALLCVCVTMLCVTALRLENVVQECV